jgi:flavorubredoxin
MSTALAENIHWVGYVDKDVRDFHGYRTDRGSTYNAYLIIDESCALIDTVKGPYAGNLVESVRDKLGGRALAYVICNHAEPDHSGGLPEVMREFPDAKLVCDAKCKGALEMHYDSSAWNFQIVAGGETLSLGKREVTFIETPMVHWPESMFTYIADEGILFSMDAFGQHFASDGRFDDEEDLEIILEEAKIYYANIVMLYGKPIAKVLDQAGGLNLKIIAPSHGVIWRKDIGRIVNAYRDWVVCKPAAKVLVLFDSMWGSTQKMAEAIADGAKEAGADVKFISIRESHITEIATETLDAAVLACGSPTLNMTLMPQVAAALTYLKGLRPTGKIGQAFGSYGWGKGGPEGVHQYLQEMRFDIAGEPIRCQFVPGPEALGGCREAGKELGLKALELAKVRSDD